MEKCEWKVGDYEEVQGLKMWLVCIRSVFKKFGCRVRGERVMIGAVAVFQRGLFKVQWTRAYIHNVGFGM